MQKLVTLPVLSPAQREVLLDSFAVLVSVHAESVTQRTVEGFSMLSASIEDGRRVFTAGQVDNMCHSLDAYIQRQARDLSSPLLSPSARTSLERDLENARSLLSLLLPLVPGHREVQHL